MNINFSSIIGKRVKRLFIAIWPPLGEDNISNLDISIGFVFDGDEQNMSIISTNKDDNWSPIIRNETIPSTLKEFNLFDDRISQWMKTELDDVIDVEYYEVTFFDIFKNILSEEIKKIEFIKIQDGNPFGVKIIFENDYIISTPISDGNTIETQEFNRNNNLKHFENLGKIHFENVF